MQMADRNVAQCTDQIVDDSPVSLLAKSSRLKEHIFSDGSASLSKDSKDLNDERNFGDDEFDEEDDEAGDTGEEDDDETDEVTSDEDVNSQAPSWTEDATSTTSTSGKQQNYNPTNGEENCDAFTSNVGATRRAGSCSSTRQAVSSTCQSMASNLGKKSQKPRRRVATLAQRRAANIRERRRMFNLNAAFDRLRKKVPSFAYEKRLSRIETLKLAIMYIRFMDNLVNDETYAQKYKLLLQQQHHQAHVQHQIHHQLIPAHQTSLGQQQQQPSVSSATTSSYIGHLGIRGPQNYIAGGQLCAASSGQSCNSSTGCESINLTQNSSIINQQTICGSSSSSPNGCQGESLSASPPSKFVRPSRELPSPLNASPGQSSPCGTLGSRGSLGLKMSPYEPQQAGSSYERVCSSDQCGLPPSYHQSATSYCITPLVESAQHQLVSGYYSSAQPALEPASYVCDIARSRLASDQHLGSTHPRQTEYSGQQHQQQQQQQLWQNQPVRYNESSSYSFHSLEAR